MLGWNWIAKRFRNFKRQTTGDSLVLSLPSYELSTSEAGSLRFAIINTYQHKPPTRLIQHIETEQDPDKRLAKLLLAVQHVTARALNQFEVPLAKALIHNVDNATDILGTLNKQGLCKRTFALHFAYVLAESHKQHELCRQAVMKLRTINPEYGRAFAMRGTPKTRQRPPSHRCTP